MQGLGGILAAVVNILLLWAGGDPVTAAFYCFLLSVLFLSGSFFAFLFASRTEFFRNYVRDTAAPQLDEATPLLDGPAKPISVAAVLRDIWVEGLTVLNIYIVTLACFPGLAVLVQSTGQLGGDTEWNTVYFVPVSCFLLYNVGDYLGRILAACSVFSTTSSRLALLFSCARLAFIPLFLLCNLAPAERSVTRVIFSSDTVYILFILLLAVSNGLLTSLVMVAAPKRVEQHQQQTASNLVCILVTT